MLRSFGAWLGLLSSVAAFPTALEKRYDGFSAPRSIMYIQTFHYTNNSDLSLLPIYEQHTRATHIYLAAVHVDSPPGAINLNDDPINSTHWDVVWSEAAQLQKYGVKVMVMLGGAAPGSYRNLCSGNGVDDDVVINEDYYIPLRNTLRYHNLDGIDLDIEERVALSCPLALLQRLNNDFGPDFILTMAPVASDLTPREYGLGGFKYSQLDSAATSPLKPNLINWFNVQFYNGWGDASSPTTYNAIIKNGYSPDRVVLGALANTADGGSGWYDIATYRKTIETLKANYPDFGGDVGWEYWDAGGSDGYSNPPQWVSEMSEATFGGPKAEPNMTSWPIPQGQSPWPALTGILEEKGVEFIEAIAALNQTNGNLEKALEWLGLGDLLGKVGDLVDDIL